MPHMSAVSGDRTTFDDLVSLNQDRLGQPFVDFAGKESPYGYTVIRTGPDEVVLHDPAFGNLHFVYYDDINSKQVTFTTSDADLVPSATMTHEGDDRASFSPG